MQLYALGLNHNTAPLAIREQMVFHAEKLQAALRELTQTKPIGEAAILSTCNRTELYLAATEPQEALHWMADYQRLKPQELKPYLYTLPKEQAVRHAFRVASGLESMVLGEPQILGQMKEAVRHAESAGTLGTLLHKLFQRSFAVAKEVRTNTQIGANVVSMAAASVKLAARIFPSLKEQKILFIGAGPISPRSSRAPSLWPAARWNARVPSRTGSAATPSSCASCRSSCTNTISSSRAPRVRFRSSARARWSAPSRRAVTGRCSWWTWPCRATSSLRSRKWTMCFFTPWTTWGRW